VAVACAKQMGVLRWNRPARAADTHRRCSARAHRRTEESGRARPALSLGDATGAKCFAQARSRGAPGASNRTRSSCRVPSPSSSRTASTNACRPAVQPRKHPRGSIRATRNEAHWNGVDALPSDGGNGSIRRMDPTCGGPWADGRARGVFQSAPCRSFHVDPASAEKPLPLLRSRTSHAAGTLLLEPNPISRKFLIWFPYCVARLHAWFGLSIGHQFGKNSVWNSAARPK
jgi:hypothetical protein